MQYIHLYIIYTHALYIHTYKPKSKRSGVFTLHLTQEQISSSEVRPSLSISLLVRSSILGNFLNLGGLQTLVPLVSSLRMLSLIS